MSIISATYEQDLDIDVWYIHELEPACNFHEAALDYWFSAEQLITEQLSDEISKSVNAAILAKLELERLAFSLTSISEENILEKLNFEHEQDLFRGDDGQGSYRSSRHPRAGPIC